MKQRYVVIGGLDKPYAVYDSQCDQRVQEFDSYPDALAEMERLEKDYQDAQTTTEDDSTEYYGAVCSFPQTASRQILLLEEKYGKEVTKAYVRYCC